MIHNPILPGFNPDPCVLRHNNDYYIATSSFEWFPAVPIYHSTDLKHWQLLTHAIKDPRIIDLRRLESAKGVWAPDLSWSEANQKFYVVFTNMYAMNARYFDLDNFLISAPSIMGPWSAPVYLNSVGFDPSLLHDDDGKQYVVSLQWETRDGYEKPGVIVAQEYDASAQKLVGYAKEIWRGGTDRGCIEAPRIYKRNGFYYLFCAEGGTGYGHCVTVARSRSVFGPYEGDPQNPIITAQPKSFNERGDGESLKLHKYSPNMLLQKCGHASIVETQDGEWYATHLCGRPFMPEKRCTLGRETAIQKMLWTSDGWFHMADGSNIAKLDIKEPSFIAPTMRTGVQLCTGNFHEDFDPVLGEANNVFATWNEQLISPRIPREGWATTAEHSGWLRLYGQQSLASLDRVSLIARRLTSINAEFSTAMRFEPEVFQHSAGLVLYYDNMNWLFLRVYYDEKLVPGKALGIVRCDNGKKTDVKDSTVPLEYDKTVLLRCVIKERQTQLYYKLAEKTSKIKTGTGIVSSEEWLKIGPEWDTSEFSDEYSSYGEFTGTFCGLFCTDSNKREKYADFDYFDYKET